MLNLTDLKKMNGQDNMFRQNKSPILKIWVILGNQSTVSYFFNKQFLIITNHKPTPSRDLG